MGSFFSFCKGTVSEDQEPLLGDACDPLPPPETPLDKIADAFAALNAGKLPSQEQINVALQKALKSDVLQAEKRDRGYGPLSQGGKDVLGDVRELIEAIIQFGMEKNDDNKIQDLVYQVRIMGNTPVSMNIDKRKTPHLSQDIRNIQESMPSTSELEHDLRHLSGSIFTITRLLFTSQNFRFLLSDIILMFRSLIADVAGDVSRIAGTIEVKAEEVEEVVRPETENESSINDSERLGKLREMGKEAKKEVENETKVNWKDLQAEAPERTRQKAIDRLQKILSDAQSTPTYSSALRTMIILARKYIERLDTIASATLNISAETSSSTSASTLTDPPVTLDTDPHLSRALENFRIVLERLAAGYGLSRFINQLQKAFNEFQNTAASSPEFKADFQRYFRDVEVTLDKALSNPGWIGSQEGRLAAEELYDRGRSLIQSDTPWVHQADKALDEFGIFTQCLASDRTTQRIIQAADKLTQHLGALFKTAVGTAVGKQRALRQELKSDLLGWIMPRMMKLLRALPIPRVEVKTEDLEAVLEGVVWQAGASFVPDHVIVENWNEIRLEASAATPELPSSAPVIQTATRTRIHIDGLRMRAHEVGYYMQYFGFCGLGWEDAGFISVDIGRPNRTGQGLSLDIDLEMESQEDDILYPDYSPFRVNGVRVSIPGLHFNLDQSRHRIINKLVVEPFAPSIIRYLISSALEKQICDALERINRFMVEVHREVLRIRRGAKDSMQSDDDSTTWNDYWNAICYVAGNGSYLLDEEGEILEDSIVVDSDTKVTLQGIIHGRVTHDNTSPDSHPDSETIIAVGMGPQTLSERDPPKKDVAKAVREEAITAVEEAERAASKAKQVGLESVDKSVKTKEKAREARERGRIKKEVERKRDGWRSPAFDVL